MMAAILAGRPAIGVAVGGELEWAGGLERAPMRRSISALNPVKAEIVDRVFEPRMGAHLAVAMIALNADHRVGRRQQPVLRDEADDVAEPRIGFGRLVGAAHAAADGDVIALQLAARGDGDEAEILRIDVDVVDRRNDEADLELARQILLAEERLLGFGCRHPLLAIPDLMIGAHVGHGVIADPPRRVVNLGMKPGERRIDRSHDAAHDVAAGRDGVDQRLVQAADRGLKVGFTTQWN